MKKQLVTLLILSLPFYLTAQIKVTPGGDFAIGQNFIPNNWVKCEINGEQKPALSLKTNFNETAWSWNSIADCNNSLTKSWIASLNGNHNFYVTNGGLVWANGSYITSDFRLKTNISPLLGSDSLLQLLEPVKFDYKIGFNGDSINNFPFYSNQYGFVAQTIKSAFPQLVLQDNDTGLIAVNYQAIIPILVSAVKEQGQRIQDLENTLELCCISFLSSGSQGPQVNSGSNLPNTINETENGFIVEDPQNFKVIPNPNNGIFTLKLNFNEIGNQVIVTDLQGKLIAVNSITSTGESTLELDMLGTPKWGLLYSYNKQF